MKIVKIALIVLMVLSISTLSFAEASKAGIKAEGGVKDILFGWTDIPRSIIEVTGETRNPLWGLTAGACKGIGKAFSRMVSGLSDVVMFPIVDRDELPVKPNELNAQIR